MQISQDSSAKVSQTIRLQLLLLVLLLSKCPTFPTDNPFEFEPQPTTAKPVGRRPFWLSSPLCYDKYYALKHASVTVLMLRSESSGSALSLSSSNRGGESPFSSVELNKLNDNALWVDIAKHKVQSLNRWLQSLLRLKPYKLNTSSRAFVFVHQIIQQKLTNNKSFLLSMHIRTNYQSVKNIVAPSVQLQLFIVSVFHSPTQTNSLQINQPIFASPKSISEKW